jgi:hypothetical protein
MWLNKILEKKVINIFMSLMGVTLNYPNCLKNYIISSITLDKGYMLKITGQIQ